MTANLDVHHAFVHGMNGKAIDVYYNEENPRTELPIVLIWHGIGPDEREILQPVAREVARQGAVVFAPDWRSDVSDGGRDHLLQSLRFVRDSAPSYGGDINRFVLAGWSAGAGAAVSVALRPELVDGWRPTAVVGIAGHYNLTARTTGVSPMSDLAVTHTDPISVRLVHGTGDDVLDIRHSREFATALRSHGWPVQLEEIDTDHAGVIMTEFNSDQGRCFPSQAEHAIRGGQATARSLILAARGISEGL